MESIAIKQTTATGESSNQKENPEKVLEKALTKNGTDDEESKIMNAEELIELKNDLLKQFDNPSDKDEHKTMGILKILQRTHITVPLLKQTMIGKTITKIVEKKNEDGKEYFQD